MRYNIDTTNGDLVQIDLAGDSWTASDDTAILVTLIKFNTDPSQSLSLSVTKKDLEKIVSNLNIILPNNN
jgi:flagellar biosynthesis GTPase FlhF